jgi:hypothetical protein
MLGNSAGTVPDPKMGHSACFLGVNLNAFYGKAFKSLVQASVFGRPGRKGRCPRAILGDSCWIFALDGTAQVPPACDVARNRQHPFSLGAFEIGYMDWHGLNRK